MNLYDIAVKRGVFTYYYAIALPLYVRVRVAIRGKETIGLIIKKLDSLHKKSSKYKNIISVIDTTPIIRVEHIYVLRKIAQRYRLAINDVIQLYMSSTIYKDMKVASEDYSCFVDKAGHYVRSVGQYGLKTRIKKGELTPVYSYQESLHKLYSQQQRAFEDIISSVQPVLLHGVTGSGKTEVYAHLVSLTLRKGLQALLLVPEIHLLTPLKSYMEKKFPTTPIVTYSSVDTATKKWKKLNAILEKKAHIIIGTRSAIYLDIPNLDLIIIDEEHDLSLRQDTYPCYNAIDIAVLRSQLAGIRVVFGSATPSTTSLHRATTGLYKYVPLVINASLGVEKSNNVHILRLDTTLPYPTFTPEVHKLIQRTLDLKQQVLIVHNRLGYKRTIYCTVCQTNILCKHCNNALVLVAEPEKQLYCRTCNKYTKSIRCHQCKKDSFIFHDYGIEELTEHLQGIYKTYGILRVDSLNYNTTLIDLINEGTVDIIVSTQIITKSHDFANIGLVVMSDLAKQIESSNPLYIEQATQLIYQSSGRAGRRAQVGRVAVVLSSIKSQVANLLRGADYLDMMSYVLKLSCATMFPPFYCTFSITQLSKHHCVSEIIALLQSVSITTRPIRYVFCPRTRMINPTVVCIAANKKQREKGLDIIDEWTAKHKIKVFYNLDPV